MTSAWTSDYVQQPPPSYEEAVADTHDLNLGGDISFIDFLPYCCDGGGLFTSPTFEPFNILIDRANIWLQNHPKCRVQTCESIEFKHHRGRVDSQKMTYLEYGGSSTYFIRGLRMWIIPHARSQNVCQQIGYFNLVPEKTVARVFGTDSFETLSELLERFNTLLDTNPTYGHILNIETQEMKLKSFSNFVPDNTSWAELGDTQKHYLIILRVFYVMTSDMMKNIGMIDFLPEKQKDAGFFSFPKYEPFSGIVRRASDWCQMQTNIRICNVQSFEVKIKSGGKLDSRRMSYTEHGGVTTSYVRILRIAYTTLDACNCAHFVSQLTCRSFVPVQLTEGILMADFESLDQTKKRVETWVKATGAKVISAETSAMRLMTGGEARRGVETTYTYNVSRRNEHFIFVIRLYLNGLYSEPPSHMMPPIQPIQSQECCVIS